MEFDLSPAETDTLIDGLDTFHQTYGDLSSLLASDERKRFRQAHRRFLENLIRQAADSGRQLANSYLELGLPFHLLMGSFNYLKTELLQIQTHRSDTGKDPFSLYARVNRLYDDARQQAARQYLDHEAGQNEPLSNAQMQNKLLIRLYRDWLERLNRALLRDLDAFPLTPANQSRFVEALQYPESLLICLDLKTCDHILEQHRLIRQKSGILYAMLAAKRHDTAYLAYREIREMVSELTHLLGVLYFESQTNRIQSFFNFAQASLYLQGEKHFCVANLRRLNHINQMYGVENGDRSLELLEDCLNELMQRHQSWMVFTRGIAGDFYIHCLRSNREQVLALMREIEECLGRMAAERALPFPIELKISGVRLTDLSELTTENMHHIVDYLSRNGGGRHMQLRESGDELEEMMEWIRQRYRQSIDLGNKLSEGNVEIFVQPLVTLDAQQEIHAFEVLGRFREENGYISAGLFIDDIVRLGLAERFDRLVLDRLIRQSGDLRRLTRRLFLNVSALTLEDAAYIEALNSALDGPLADFEIVLELTEQILLENLELVFRLHQQHGLNFAIDDFGTGFSSLQTVIELALKGGIQYLKIDGSLTQQLGQNPASEQIIRITQQMARELKLQTVVEYIETLDQMDTLNGIDIDFGQGYLLGIPDPVKVWLGKLAYLQSKAEARLNIGV